MPLGQDLRFAFRLLRTSPGFTALVILTLGLGIGANTAIFTLADAAFLRPLPYRNGERLVHIWETRTRREFPRMEASYPNYLDWIRQNHVFEAIAGYAPASFTLTGRGLPQRISATRVTANFFRVLGVEPILGRDFRPEEETRSAERVAVLSYGFWRRHFAGDPAALGARIELGGVAYTVIGVLPAGFHFAPNGVSEAWLTLAMNDDQASRRTFHWLLTIARLRAGVSLKAARGEMSTIAARLAAEYPAANFGGGVEVLPLREEFVAEIRPVLVALVAGVTAVLLLASVSIANLLLARAGARGREIAVRAALGASRARLVAQLAAENLLLALLGGGAALLVASWTTAALPALVPAPLLDNLPYLRNLGMDHRVLAINLLVALGAGMLFGVAPALASARVPVAEALKQDSHGATGTAWIRSGRWLVATQIALALVLLVATGLVLRSLARVLGVDPGFRTAGVVTLRLSLPPRKYTRDADVSTFYAELERRAAALPGVEAAAIIDELPLTGDGGTVRILAAGRPAPAPGQEYEATTRTASPAYFRTLGIPMRAGRGFAASDDAAHPRAVVVSETLAHRLFPGENPVGQKIVVVFDRSVWEVIGVVADVKLGDLDRAVRPAFYTSNVQDPSRSAHLVVRTRLDPPSIAESVREIVRALDPELPIYGVRSMDHVLSESAGVFTRRFAGILLAAFSGLAVGIAAIGLYGVCSSSVAARTREIGIRMALGAERARILRLVLGAGLGPALGGIAAGLAGGLVATRLLEALLFGVEATDPWTFAAAAAGALAVALLACYLPARRAARLDPMAALRVE